MIGRRSGGSTSNDVKQHTHTPTDISLEFVFDVFHQDKYR